MKKVFTISEAAKICKATPNTVTEWFDNGQIKGYRIPVTNERQIPREYLIRFLKEHDIPLGELEDDRPKVLIVTQDQALVKVLKEAMSRDFGVSIAASGFEAGITASSMFSPDCLVVDFAINHTEVLGIAREVKKELRLPIIGILASYFTPDPAIFEWSTGKPFDPNFFVNQVRNLIKAKEHK